MNASSRVMHIGQVYRYPRPPRTATEYVDGHQNYNYLSAAADGRRVPLESGINPVKVVRAVDGERRPAVALRSSPWKAGRGSTPWHDVFDLKNGRVRYFGDHRVDTMGEPGSTRGNAELQRWWARYNPESSLERTDAAPLLVFRSVTVEGAVKGHVEFCGVAIIETLESIVQVDPATGESFENYAFNLAVLDLSAESDAFDWQWIDDRRDPCITRQDALRRAPRSWKVWVENGTSELVRIRRADGSASRDRLAEGASPRVIRSALWPQDQPEFDAAYEAALAEAKTSQDLTRLFSTLERWRGIAVLQSDPEVFRRVARRAAETLTVAASPDDEPLAVTRGKADM